MSFTWDGVNCETLGMYVERYPARQFAQRKATVYDVPGRSGALIIDEDAYTNVSQEYEVFVKGGTAGLQSKLDMIAAWLLTKEGYANLSDSYDTTVTRKARVANAIDFLNSLNRFGKATIIFDCCPQRYPLTEESFSELYANGITGTITYPSGTGLQPAYPLIELSPINANTETVITIKNLVITITATVGYPGLIIIDSETQSIYDQDTRINPPEYTIAGEWEKLGDGDTVSAVRTIGSGTGTFTVKTRRFKL